MTTMRSESRAIARRDVPPAGSPVQAPRDRAGDREASEAPARQPVATSREGVAGTEPPAMTLPGAGRRLLRSPAFRPGSPRIGGDRCDRPGSPGRVSAAARGIAGALDGVRWLGRAAVPALLLLTLLAGVATQASAQTLPKVYFQWSSQSHSEASGTRYVTLCLWPPQTSDVTVNYTVAGTAASGSDYEALSGTATVPARRKSVRIPVKLIDDSVQEGSETLVLKPTGSADYRVEGTHTLTILDDETAPVVSLEQLSGREEVQEWEGTYNFKVKLDPAPTSPITLNYRMSGSATSGSDYVTPPGTLSVPAGTETANIPVTIIDDDEGETYESIILKLIDGSGYQVARPQSAWVSIRFSDRTPTAYFATDSLTAAEGSGAHEVKLTLWHSVDNDLAVKYRVRSCSRNRRTPTPGLDYTALSGTVTVPKGRNIVTIPITIIDDGVPEGDECFLLELVRGEGYIPFQAPSLDQWVRVEVTVTDNDTPTVSFASASQSAGEGTGTRDVEVSLSPAPTTDITLAYTVGGTATSGSDFTIAGSGTLSVPKGATTATIPVTLIDDSVQERGETVVLTLSGSASYGVGSPGAHTLTILDDEPAVYFASASQDADEGSGTHDVEVKLNKAPATDITLAYTVGGTATSGSDFTIASSGTLSVPKGATAATIPVTLIDDSVQERGETVVLTLVGSAGYPVVNPGAHTLTIRANDRPTASFASAFQNVGEGSGTRDVEVRLNPAPGFDITLAFRVGGPGHGAATAGSDFTIPNSRRVLPGTISGTLSVPAGATTAAIPVTFIDDSVHESVETMTLMLAESPDYRIAGPPRHYVYISDNDGPKMYFASASQSVAEGSGMHDVVVRLNPAPTTDVTFTYTVGGTATAGSDFTIANSGTLSVPKGATTATIPVTIIDDSVEDSGETVVLTLIAGNGYAVGATGTHTLTIQNHEPAVPTVTVVRKAGTASSITEGGDAAFTLTADPAPALPLAVTVAVASDGDWGVTAGSRTVTIPATGSATLTLATTGDATDEPDGSVSVTVAAGSGYTVGASASGTVSVRDDDDAPADAAVDPALVAEVRAMAEQTQHGAAHVKRWRRVLVAFGVEEYPGLTPTAAAEAEANAQKYSSPLWPRIAEALAKLEAAPDTPPVTLPEVTVSADAASVTEGGDAAFTLTATPAPAADLPVTVTVASDGDWGVTAGSRTVTIPATGSATLTLATTGDATDEPDGSVSVTVAAGSGYTVGASASGTVSVQDDDDAPADAAVDPALVAEVRAMAAQTQNGAAHVKRWRRVLVAFGVEEYPGLTPTTAAEAEANAQKYSSPLWPRIAEALAKLEAAAQQDQDPPQQQEPEITVTANAASVTEGGDAVFTLTASPAPAADLAVTVTVATDGDWGVTAGSRTVTIPTTGSATLTLATADDAADEPDGSVTRDGGGRQRLHGGQPRVGHRGGARRRRAAARGDARGGERGDGGRQRGLHADGEPRPRGGPGRQRERWRPTATGASPPGRKR